MKADSQNLSPRLSLPPTYLTNSSPHRTAASACCQT